MLMPIVGVSWRDDALERRKWGGGVGGCGGAVTGAMLIFSGGNIGEGETIWSTVGCRRCWRLGCGRFFG